MDSSEYKHVVLGIVFLKYIDDAFAKRWAQLSTDLATGRITGKAAKEPLESRDEYTAEGVFCVPPEARWEYLQSNAKQPEIGKLIEVAMDAVEMKNPSLRGVLPKKFARPILDVRRLGELVYIIDGLGLGGAEHKEKDLLGRVYEYFLGRFASQGKERWWCVLHAANCWSSSSSRWWSRTREGSTTRAAVPGDVHPIRRVRRGSRWWSQRHCGLREEMNDTTWRLAKINLAI